MATAEEIAKFRRQIGDPVKADADVQTASGNDRQFALRYNNLFDELVTINGVEVDNDDYTLDGVAGLIEFPANLVNGDQLRVSYKYAAYTDVEATSLIDEYGVSAATVEALKELLASAARLYNYQQGPTRADKQQVFSNLKDLFKIYKGEADVYASSGGLTMGKRTNPTYRDDRPRIAPDFSRDDI